jgi:ribosomal protein S18 acetylase RimI-like enzyme
MTTHDYEMRPFTPPEAETVAGWAASPEDAWAVSGASEPLTGDQVAAWTYETDYAFTLRRDGDLVAYGEVLEDVVEGDVEIQHLLVAPDMRGVGVGKALLSRLCAFLAAARPYPEVWLRVGRENAAAALCARGVGFEDVAGMSGPRYLWLKKRLRPASADSQ